MMAAVFLLAALVSGCAAAALIPLLQRRGVIDTPNARSSHKAPTPRGGGIGVCLGIVAGLALAFALGLPGPPAALLAGAAIIFAAGLADDYLRGIPSALRFGAQLLAAGTVVATLGPAPTLPLPAPADVDLGGAAFLLSGFWIVAVVNFYNFLDGIDGYAGAQGLLAGAGLAWYAPGSPVAVLGLAAAGASLGFLFVNWRPARIFMGDAGSTTLGFLFAASPWMVESPDRGKAVFTVGLLLWFFLADGAFTLIRRLIAGEKIWQAHRSHVYQRLTQAGWRHDQVVGFAMLLALIPAGLVLALGMTWATLGAGVMAFAVFGAVAERALLRRA